MPGSRIPSGPLRRVAIVGAAALLLVAASTGYAVYRESRAAAAAHIPVDHTYEVLEQIRLVFSTVQEAESGARGYYVNGDESSLDNYMRAAGSLGGEIDTLERLTADNPAQTARIATLRKLALVRMMRSMAVIELRGATPEATEAESTNAAIGSQAMAGVRAVVDEMVAEERALLAIREAAHERQTRINLGIVTASLVIALLAIAATGIVTLGHLVRRREAEAELAARSARLSATLACLTQGVRVCDADLRLIAWNQRYLELAQFPPELARPGVSFTQILTRMAVRGDFGGEASAEAFVTNRMAQLRARQESTMEFMRTDGTILEVRDSYSAEGYYVTTLTDITERKQVEQTLRALTAFQSVMFDAAATLIIVTNMEAVITRFNAAAERLLGYTASEVVGSHTPLLFFDRDEIAARARELSAELGRTVEPGIEVFRVASGPGRPDRREWSMTRKDGSGVPVLLSVTPLRDKNEVLGYIGVGIDITERKLAEQRTREGLARLTAIYDNALDGLITIAESGLIESFSPAAERIFGYRAEEVVGRNVNRLMPEPYHSAHDGYLRNYLAGGESKILGTRRELEARRKDGKIVPIEIAVSEMWLERRRLFLGAVRDISERKEVDRLKNEFVSIVSHELRTPLTSIAGALGLLEAGAVGALPEKAERLVGIAHANSERLVRLINDILDTAKIESGRMDFSFSPLSIRRVVEDSIEANRAYAEEYGVRLTLDAGAADGTVYGDPDRLAQVFTNLLSNAVKFSPVGQTVAIGIERGAETVQVSVRDHGPGIPAEFHSRIFQKFAQADASDSRRKGGTGLGLSIAKSIVDRHGGAISFESRPGQGAVFRVDLPVWHEDRAVAERRDAAQPAREPTA